MAELMYKIEFFSDWHTGSGLSAGADVDALTIKDSNNLPFIPGKTLKGLLKDVAQNLMYCDEYKNQKGVIDEIFGTDTEKDTQENVSISTKGKAFFSNGELSKNLKKQLTTNNNTHLLYRNIASTKINEHGLAEEHSLRRIEVTIPLTLFAKIENIEEKHMEILTKCLHMVKRIGVGRNRGLGRCQLTVAKGE